MKRRSFLQAVVAAVVGLPALFGGGKRLCSTETDDMPYFCDQCRKDYCICRLSAPTNTSKVAIIESGGDGSYSWREVTLEFTPNGHFLSAKKGDLIGRLS